MKTYCLEGTRVNKALLTFLITLVGHGPASAGGGPANVLILANSDDPSAMLVADHYATARALPPGHICEIYGVDLGALTIDFALYETTILAGLDDCLSTLPQPDEIDYLVVVRGLPYKVTIPDGFSTSLQAMLQVGHTTHAITGEPLAGRGQTDSDGTFYATVRNPFFVGGGPSELFELSNPSDMHYTSAAQIVSAETQPRAITRGQAVQWFAWDFTDNLFIVSRLDGFDHDDAMDLVDRAVDSDGTFPSAPITCMHAADDARGARDPECHFVVGALESAGIESEWIEPFDGTLSGKTLSGFLTGTTSLQNAIDGNTFVPGAFAGNLTSFGAAPSNFVCSFGACPESENQTSIARFVRAGATGAHGTTNEPLNNSFPSAGMFLFQTMGYGMIESAMLTQRYLYWQNIYLGDPLTAPWAERPVVSITEPVVASEPTRIVANHPHGISETRLYVDGVRVDPAKSLTETTGAAAGDMVEILAIAVAENVVISRPDWVMPETLVRSDIQGWTTAVVTLEDATPEVADVPEDAAKEKSGGCAHAPRPNLACVGWFLALGLASTRRRQR
jgi:uncharacterized protein (TIGR03790 family)